MNDQLPPKGPAYDGRESGGNPLSGPWYSAKQVGEIYHVSKPLLLKWRSKSGLAFSKVGKKIRYNKTDIDNFLLRFRNPGVGLG